MGMSIYCGEPDDAVKLGVNLLVTSDAHSSEANERLITRVIRWLHAMLFRERYGSARNLSLFEILKVQ